MQLLLQVLLYGCMIIQACQVARGAVLPEPHILPQDHNGFKLCYDMALEQAQIEQRKSLLKQEIQYKLHLEGSPDEPPEDLVIPPETLASYRAAVTLEETISAQEKAQERQEGCGERNTFYAKEIMLFFPSLYQGDIPSVNSFDWDLISGTKRVKREKKEDNNDKPPTIEKETFDKASTESVPQPKTVPPTEGLSGVSDSITAQQKSLQELLTPIQYELQFSDIRSRLPAHTPVWSATLQLYKRKVIHDSTFVKREANPTENVEIYWMSTTVAEDGKTIEYPILIKSQDIWTENDEYISFDVTEGVRTWLRDELSEQLDLKVVIRCPESVSTGLLFLPSVQFDTASKGPHNANLIIKVLVDSGNNSRTRRSTVEGSTREYCLANPDESHCCLKETTVNIKEDLGLNWVLAPRTFQFTYCLGLCPRIWPSSTLNMEYRGRLRAVNPTSSPEPCCVPHDTRPLTVLTYENGHLVLKQLTGLIVDSCQCR